MAKNPTFRWGGKVFASPQGAVNWMNARGQGTTVKKFLGNHPGLASSFGQKQSYPVPPRNPVHRALAVRAPSEVGKRMYPTQHGAIPAKHAVRDHVARNLHNSIAKLQAPKKQSYKGYSY